MLGRLWLMGVVSVVSLMLASGCVHTGGEQELTKWAPRERAEAHVQLGLLYLRQNQFATAAHEFDAALAIDPNSAQVQHAKALLLSRTGNDTQASQYFARAVALAPDNFLAVNDYAIHQCQQPRPSAEQIAVAIAQLERIATLPANQQRLSSWLGLGICHATAAEWQVAHGYLQRVLAQAPTLPQALLPMAEIGFETENYLSSRAFLERYFNYGTRLARPLFLAARVEQKLGDLPRAYQYRRELQQQFPQSALNATLAQLLP